MPTLRSIVKFNVEIDRQLYDVTGLVRDLIDVGLGRFAEMAANVRIG